MAEDSKNQKIKNVVYISRACSNNMYNRLSQKTSIAANKFNKLIMEGISDKGINVYAIGTFDTCFEKVEIEKQGNTYYYGIPKVGIFKKILIIVKILNSLFREKDTVLIADYLSVVISLVAVLLSKFYKITSISVVTDLPEYMGDSIVKERLSSREKIYTAISYMTLRRFDKYVLLTEPMMDKIANKKPYIVMEGVVDNFINNDNVKREKSIIYAGSLHKEYGIELLIRAFLQLQREDFVLNIYGQGNYQEELEKVCEQNKNIVYHGLKENEYVVKKEREAYLLINPRPTSEEFTKYSFPSKNMEYMLTGTPVLTANLPGMPKEYLEYVYIFKEETYMGIAECLAKILKKDPKEHFFLGKKAQTFVLEKKNKCIQAERILDFAED